LKTDLEKVVIPPDRQRLGTVLAVLAIWVVALRRQPVPALFTVKRVEAIAVTEVLVGHLSTGTFAMKAFQIVAGITFVHTLSYLVGVGL
jgi:hypothetical protein